MYARKNFTNPLSSPRSVDRSLSRRKFKILSKTPAISFFFRSKKSVSVARRYTTGERAFLTSGATRGRARNKRHFAYHENQASGRRLMARA